VIQHRESASSRRIKLAAVRKDQIDMDWFVAALLALAIGRLEKEKAQKRLPTINLLPPASEADRGAA